MSVIGHEWATGLLLNGWRGDECPTPRSLLAPQVLERAPSRLPSPQALNCTGEDPAPCGECYVVPQDSPVATTLTCGYWMRRTRHSRSAKWRELQRELSLSPHEGHWRVSVLTDFERQPQLKRPMPFSRPWKSRLPRLY